MADDWTNETAATALATRGCVISIGQIPASVARYLNARAKAGELIKYRGFWDTASPRHGMGYLKTIWATPEFVARIDTVDRPALRALIAA